MSAKRLAQVNELIRQELSLILNRELDFPAGCLVTVSGVKVSVDLEHASVYVKIYPTAHTQAAWHILIHRLKEIQTLLNRKLVMRFVPKIFFRLDASEEKADHIERLIDQLHKNNG